MSFETWGSLVAILFLCGCGGGGGVPAAFSISSSSYADNGVIPAPNACQALGGSDLSPQLTLRHLPSNASTIAILMDDEVAPCETGVGACVHWAVFNLPASKTTFAEGESLGSISGVTYGQTYDGNAAGYAGPCPPNDHIYKLTVFALNADTPTIAQGTSLTRSTFASTYAANIVGQSTWTGRYPN